jgi:hypothetical protein
MRSQNMCGNITARARERRETFDKAFGLAFPRAQMKRFFVAGALAFFAAVAAQAGTEPLMQPTALQENGNPFARGTKEFQNVTGANFFFDTTQNQRPAVDFARDSLRLGIMLNDPQGPGFLAGNFEVLGEAFAGGIFDGPGNVMAGSNLIFRYNFIQPRARIIPYLQIGAGLVYTDIPEGESRGLISLPVEFDLQGIAGMRFMLNPRWSLVVEGAYRHISNAEIHLPNFGIDSAGGNVGFGFSF